MNPLHSSTVPSLARKSNFELLRLVAMFFILYYHFLYFFITKIDSNTLYEALYIPLHVAVLCFVMISGYFHIKPSLKGIIKLISPLVVFYLPLTALSLLLGHGHFKDLLFFSHSPYWFIRIYFFLFVIAPVLNFYLNRNKNHIYLLIVLGFISIYMGTMQDPSLKDGKNLPLFMFLYVLGDCCHYYNFFINKLKTRWLLLAYFFINVGVVSLYLSLGDSIAKIAVWLLCFPYCSPVLLINSLLLFIIFCNWDIPFNKTINWLSGSVFAIYILHHQDLILTYLLKPAVHYIYYMNSNPFILLFCLAVFTIGVMLIMILIDKMFNPLWRYLSCQADKFYNIIISHNIWIKRYLS